MAYKSEKVVEYFSPLMMHPLIIHNTKMQTLAKVVG
jgi:hypothetical protein